MNIFFFNLDHRNRKKTVHGVIKEPKLILMFQLDSRRQHITASIWDPTVLEEGFSPLPSLQTTQFSVFIGPPT